MQAKDAKQFARSPEIIWFIARGDLLKGPYTTEQVEQAIQKREVSYFDFCWRQGFREWRPVTATSEFERRGKLRRLPTYPVLPPPTNENFAREPQTKKPLSPKAEPTVRISFAKSARRNITAYEWAAAVVFSVCLAAFSVHFALNEVKNGLLSRMEVSLLGRPMTVGESENAVPPAIYEPLFSAPGLVEVTAAQESRGIYATGKSLDFNLPATIEGHAIQPVVGGRSPASVGVGVAGFQVAGAKSMPVWTASDFDLDPVYSKSVIVNGFMNPGHGPGLSLRLRGEPLLESYR